MGNSGNIGDALHTLVPNFGSDEKEEDSMRIAVLTNQTGDTVLNRLNPHAREQSQVTCEAVVEALTSLGHERLPWRWVHRSGSA